MAAEAEQISLTPEQSRHLAARALQDGNPDLAADIATILLQRDSGDAVAHYLLAQAHAQRGETSNGRRQAALAFRDAGSTSDRFHAAQLAARLAAQDQAHLAGQYWLRRSLQFAPSQMHRDRVVSDFKLLRNAAPAKLSGWLSIAPSSNLNNGAEGADFTINGARTVFGLSGSAQALSGIRATGGGQVDVKLSASETHRTGLLVDYFGQRVQLSDEAQAQAPTMENRDLAFDRLRFSLRHAQRVGQGRLFLDAGLGKSWYGRSPYQNLAHVGVGYGTKIGKNSVQILSRAERLSPTGTRGAQIDALDLGLRVSRALPSGNTLTYGVDIRGTDSPNANDRMTRQSAFVGLDLAKPVGPATVSARIGAAFSSHPDYNFAGYSVPGGRDDQTIFGSLDITFDKLDYAGFVPSVRVQGRKTSSNVSRYRTNEVSISLGINSSF